MKKTLRDKLKDYFSRKKILLKYSLKVLKIKQRLWKNPNYRLRVIFLANEDAKWNYDILYKLMKQDERFEPILVFVPRTHPSRHTPENIAKNYAFFKERYPEVIWGYDCKTKTYHSLKGLKPDIIFYTQPWDIHPQQNIAKVCNFALTCYCPYPLAESPETLIVNLWTFHCNLWKHFIVSDAVKEQYRKEMGYTLPSIVVTGHPKLDTYMSREEKDGKDYIIYSPHCSFPRNSWSKCATFEWNGRHILEYAKQHPEFNWVFKPHPDVYRNLHINKIMTEKEVKEYYDTWASIGTYYNVGNYFHLFKNSRCLITDCISFLGEYLPSKNPVIHLRSKYTVNYSALNQEVIKNYYQAWDLEELDAHLKTIVEQKQDPMREQRLQCLAELKLGTESASQNIINHIKKSLGVK